MIVASAWVPVVAALAGAAVGFIGAGTVRLLLDRRQELVRAQAFARVILEELRAAAARLEPQLIEQNPFLAFGPIADDAWRAHRSDIAAVVLAWEFTTLTTVYRAIS